jgi:hypothetical protein
MKTTIDLRDEKIEGPIYNYIEGICEMHVTSTAVLTPAQGARLYQEMLTSEVFQLSGDKNHVKSFQHPLYGSCEIEVREKNELPLDISTETWMYVDE